MSGNLLNLEERQKRGYYAGLIRTTCVVLVSRDENKFPWESDAWQQDMPELSAFLCDTETKFTGPEEEYIKILRQFSTIANKNKWLNQYLHQFAEKDQARYLPPKPFNKKIALMAILVLSVGVLIGGILF